MFNEMQPNTAIFTHKYVLFYVLCINGFFVNAFGVVMASNSSRSPSSYIMSIQYPLLNLKLYGNKNAAENADFEY